MVKIQTIQLNYLTKQSKKDLNLNNKENNLLTNIREERTPLNQARALYFNKIAFTGQNLNSSLNEIDLMPQFVANIKKNQEAIHRDYLIANSNDEEWQNEYLDYLNYMNNTNGDWKDNLKNYLIKEADKANGVDYKKLKMLKNNTEILIATPKTQNEINEIRKMEANHFKELSEKKNKYDTLFAERTLLNTDYESPENSNRRNQINQAIEPLELWEEPYFKYLSYMDEKLSNGSSWKEAHSDFIKNEFEENLDKGIKPNTIKLLRSIYAAKQMQPLTAESVAKAIRAEEFPLYGEVSKVKKNEYLPDEVFKAGLIVENLAKIIDHSSDNKTWIERTEKIYLEEDPIAKSAYNRIIKEFTPIFENSSEETKKKLAALSDLESLKIFAGNLQEAVKNPSVNIDILTREGFDLRKIYQTAAKNEAAAATSVTFYPILGKLKDKFKSYDDADYNKISDGYSSSVNKMRASGYNMSDPKFIEGWAEKDAFGLLCQRYCSKYMEVPKQLFMEFKSEPSENVELLSKKAEKIVKDIKKMQHMDFFEIQGYAFASKNEAKLFNSIYDDVFNKLSAKTKTVNGTSTLKVIAAMIDMEFAQIILSKLGKESRPVPVLVQEIAKGTFEPKTEREFLFSEMLQLKKSFIGIDKDLDDISNLLSFAVRNQDGGALDNSFPKRCFITKNAILRACADVCRDQMEGKEFRILRSYDEQETGSLAKGKYPKHSLVSWVKNADDENSKSEILKANEKTIIEKNGKFFLSGKEINQSLVNFLTANNYVIEKE